MNTRNLILFLITLLFPGFTIKAQVAIQNKLSPEEYKPSLVELKKINSSPHKLLFIDEREDTTRMGFLWGSNRQYYFTFPKPAYIYMEEKMNSKKSERSDTLYIGIKRLWISQVNKPPTLARSFLLNSYATIGYCRIHCNFYKKEGGKYYLMYTYDNIISKNGYLGNTKDKLMDESLTSMKAIADSIVNEKISSKNLYFPGTIISKPILLAEKLNDGIYLTFEDFINNKPVDLNFTYSVTKETEKIILKETKNDDSVYTNQCWGFCKNNTPYMRIGSRFSKLTKIQNTFELRLPETLPNRNSKEFDAFWLGFNIAQDLRSGIPVFALSDIFSYKSSPETIMRISPYKLDLETGNVY